MHNVVNNLLRYACSITPDDDTLIMTGGQYTMNTVSLYNRRGWVKNLDSLSTGRRLHACGYYKNNDGDTVRNMISFSILINMMYQVYLVTGGYDGNYRLSSTEILPSLTSQWIILEGANLPRAMLGVRSVSVDNNIILTGNIIIVIFV